MAFVALASLSVNAPGLEKLVYLLRHHLVQGPESESLCLQGPNPQQSVDLTIQIVAQLFYQILNLALYY